MYTVCSFCFSSLDRVVVLRLILSRIKKWSLIISLLSGPRTQSFLDVNDDDVFNQSNDPILINLDVDYDNVFECE